MEFIVSILNWFEEKVIGAIGDPTTTDVMKKLIDAIKGLLGILPEQEAGE